MLQSLMKPYLTSCVTAGLLLSANIALAVGTVAGTDIDNTAQIDYDVAGTPQTTTSNTVTVRVAEVLDVNVTLLSGPASASAGDTDQGLLFVVTNIGNGDEEFSLAIDNALGGDDFNPIDGTPATIYFDTDGSGDFSAGDVAYDGSNNPVLAPDASIDILLVNDIPAALADGLTGLSELSAVAETASGTPGDRYPGLGDDGVTAIVGSTGAADSDNGQYIIGDIQLALVKSAVVADLFGGSDPLPGSEITYQIVLTPTGSDTANNIIFTDAIPVNTTYLADSIVLNGSGLTDAADADVGEYSATPSPEIIVDLGDLTGTDSAQIIEFTVTID